MSQNKFVRGKEASRRLQVEVYTLLERPLGARLLYHAALTSFLLLCILLSVLGSTSSSPTLALVLFLLELLLLLWFTLEFVLRIWSAGCRPQYHGVVGRLRFLASSPAVWVDLVTTATAGGLLLGGAATAPSLPLALTTGLRLLQILRMFRIDRSVTNLT